MNQVTAQLAGHEDWDKAEDNAFAEGRRWASKRPTRFETAASLSGTKPRTPSSGGRQGREQALLAASGLIPARFERDDGHRGFEEIWHSGLVPLDTNFWAQSPCAWRTANFATSPEGRRDILNSTSFAELNQARAIGGAVTIKVASMRATALKNPDDTRLRHAVALCANAAFRFFYESRRW